MRVCGSLENVRCLRSLNDGKQVLFMHVRFCVDVWLCVECRGENEDGCWCTSHPCDHRSWIVPRSESFLFVDRVDPQPEGIVVVVCVHFRGIYRLCRPNNVWKSWVLPFPFWGKQSTKLFAQYQREWNRLFYAIKLNALSVVERSLRNRVPFLISLLWFDV